jgi:hypothetical protein
MESVEEISLVEFYQTYQASLRARGFKIGD